MRKVFISHATADCDWVRSQIVDPLSAQGWSCFFSKDHIGGGEDWSQRLVDELSAADRLVVVVSAGALGSKFVLQEIDWWIENRCPNHPVPVSRDGVNVDTIGGILRLRILLQQFQCIDFSRGQVDSFPKLLRALEAPVRGRLKHWLARHGWIGVVAGLLVACYLVQAFVGVGPPWPEPAAGALISWLAILAAWHFSAAERRQGLAHRPLFQLLATIFATGFILLMVFFALPAPEAPEFETRGFLLRNEFADVLKNHPELNADLLVEQYNWVPANVWIPWTVYLVRALFWLTWLGLIWSLSAIAHSFWQRTKEMH